MSNPDLYVDTEGITEWFRAIGAIPEPPAVDQLAAVVDPEAKDRIEAERGPRMYFSSDMAFDQLANLNPNDVEMIVIDSVAREP